MGRERTPGAPQRKLKEEARGQCPCFAVPEPPPCCPAAVGDQPSPLQPWSGTQARLSVAVSFLLLSFSKAAWPPPEAKALHWGKWPAAASMASSGFTRTWNCMRFQAGLGEAAGPGGAAAGKCLQWMWVWGDSSGPWQVPEGRAVTGAVEVTTSSQDTVGWRRHPGLFWIPLVSHGLDFWAQTGL